MQRLAQSIADILFEGNVIKEDDRDSCRYGLEVMLSSISEILCILIISIFVRNFVTTLVFFIAFIPLRIYAGGYHADTRIRCFAILVAVYAIFTACLHFVPEQVYMYIILGGTSFTMLMTLLLSPVLHSRKHLNQNEIKAFRKIAIGIGVSETIIVLIGIFTTGSNVYILSFVFGQLAVSISMVAACIKKHMKGSESE